MTRSQAAGGARQAPALPPLRRRPINSLRDCQRQMCRVYWEARNGKIATQDAMRFVLILRYIGDAITGDGLEARLAAIEERFDDAGSERSTPGDDDDAD